MNILPTYKDILKLEAVSKTTLSYRNEREREKENHTVL